MSQHYYRTTTPDGRPVTVLMGWDRPLQQFFLVVEYEDSEGDEYLYSNLNDPRAQFQPLPYFGDKLTGLGIQVPEAMFVEVERDRSCDAGNRQVWHERRGVCAECP